MTDPTTEGEVRAALHELQQYLSDRVPPLSVAESVEFLLRFEPQVIASEIQAWAGTQYQGAGSSIPLSDYLFHAMKKLHWLGEYKLIPEEKLQTYLQELGPEILEVCPDADRELLTRSLASLGRSTGTTANRVEIVHRQAGSRTTLAAPAATASTTESAADAAPVLSKLAPNRPFDCVSGRCDG